jgi:hypothetical protein
VVAISRISTATPAPGDLVEDLHGRGLGVGEHQRRFDAEDALGGDEAAHADHREVEGRFGSHGRHVDPDHSVTRSELVDVLGEVTGQRNDPRRVDLGRRLLGGSRTCGRHREDNREDE